MREERLAVLLEDLTTGPIDQAHDRLEKLCLSKYRSSKTT